MSLTVRRIGADDGAVLREVRLAALRDAPGAFASTYEAEAELAPDAWDERARRGAEGPLTTTVLACRSGQVVGLVAAYRDAADAPDVELVSMWVAPGSRREGIAAALAEAVLRWAAGTGAAAVHLWVTAGNEPASSLYRVLGFGETGEVQPLPSDPVKAERRMTRLL